MRPPEQAPEVGMPVPDWLGRGKTVTGHLEGIDPERILLRSLGYGNVLFHVDDKTIVRVDKTRLSLSDLKEGDAVAVKLKEIKGKGPYALEIMAHPEVLRRKERGGKDDSGLIATPIEGAISEAPVTTSSVPASAPVAAAGVALPPRVPADLPVPALPRGQKGVTGTITEVNGEQAKVESPQGRRQDVLITSVTRIVRASNNDQVLSEVRAGDKVAVVGDTLDSGLLIAREILVNRPVEVEAASIPFAPATPAVRGIDRDRDRASSSGEFSGIITAISGESMHVRTSDGKDREVLVTPVAIIRRWNAEVPFSVVRQGDQVSVKGDVLEGGVTIAREVIVTKPAGK